MSVTVLLFASWADALGSSLTLDLPAHAQVRDVLATLAERVQGRSLPTPLVAVNQRYARPETVLREADEVAIIPPVAGG